MTRSVSLALLLATALAGCQTNSPARPAPGALTGAVALEPLDWRPRAGRPPADFGRDVPSAMTAALASALGDAGIGLDGQRCRLEGTVRDFRLADGLFHVDVRYVLATGGTVRFDQAIGTYDLVPPGTGTEAAADAAMAKNLRVLLADDWFRTLLRQECAGRA
jgi:hypothetical protein